VTKALEHDFSGFLPRIRLISAELRGNGF
jgi:hypothetical protein